VHVDARRDDLKARVPVEAPAIAHLILARVRDSRT
jgi:hypothetical protein